MTEGALASVERLAPARRLNPEEEIAQAKKWATALMQVVKDTGISVTIGKREYLKVEAWQTLARFNACWIDTEWTHDIKDGDGRIVGVEARARLMTLHTGQSLGGAEGACMMDEELETWEGQVIERWTDYYAVKSMAQTRAQGKVGRMAYAWVAVLAGYESTPAEEMLGVKDAERQTEGKDQSAAQRVCPHCKKPAIIKGRLEYGGGWLCFKKKDGCGAKWTDAEWVALSQPKAEQDEVPTSATPAAETLTEAQTTAELRDILLGRVNGLSDKLKLPVHVRAELWAQYCSRATPENVDPAALNDLYAAIQKRGATG